jgi:hypothetical protein
MNCCSILEERNHMATLQLTADDYLFMRINAVHLKYRLGDIETDCCDRLRASSKSWEL